MRKTDEQRGDWKEWRRRRAWELAERRWNQKEIAEALGVTQGAVSQWMKMGREQGEEGLRGKSLRDLRTIWFWRASPAKSERIAFMCHAGKLLEAPEDSA